MKKILLLLLVVCSTYNAYSQFNSQRRGQGRNGSIAPSAGIENREPEKPDFKQMAEERVAIYAQELELDPFTKEVVKTHAKDYYKKKLDIQFDKNLNRDDKLPLLNELEKKYETNLGEVLSQEQVQKILSLEQFGTRQIEKQKKRKSKRERRRKKKAKN